MQKISTTAPAENARGMDTVSMELSTNAPCSAKPPRKPTISTNVSAAPDTIWRTTRVCPVQKEATARKTNSSNALPITQVRPSRGTRPVVQYCLDTTSNQMWLRSALLITIVVQVVVSACHVHPDPPALRGPRNYSIVSARPGRIYTIPVARPANPDSTAPSISEPLVLRRQSRPLNHSVTPTASAPMDTLWDSWDLSYSVDDAQPEATALGGTSLPAPADIIARTILQSQSLVGCPQNPELDPSLTVFAPQEPTSSMKPVSSAPPISSAEITSPGSAIRKVIPPGGRPNALDAPGALEWETQAPSRTANCSQSTTRMSQPTAPPTHTASRGSSTPVPLVMSRRRPQRLSRSASYPEEA